MVNDPALAARAEIIWEKGTNRSAFWRGEVDKYNWVDLGSSFLPSEINAAYLFAQLEEIDRIQTKRIALWNRYSDGLQSCFRAGLLQAPAIPTFATNNGHMYYAVCPDAASRDRLIAGLKQRGIHAVFHYQSLHASPFFTEKHDGRALPNADRYSQCLVRFPLYHDLELEEVDRICAAVPEILETILEN